MTEPTRRNHVVVFGVDGVRYDALCATATPALDAIGAAGFIRPVRVDQAAPTISGPSWATIATGVLADRHRILGNQLRGHRIPKYPDFLTRVRENLPGRTTYAAAAWPQLVHETAGGPILLGGGYLPYSTEPQDLAEWEDADNFTANHACRVLGSADIAAAFVYFALPDMVAHRHGMSAAYAESITGSDQRIGKVIEAIRARRRFAEERWTFIAVTDHGHADDGGHGGDSEPERTAWIAASGPGVPVEPPADLELADVHAEVLSALNIGIRPKWALTGRPFNRVA